jgi:hypothetical protein
MFVILSAPEVRAVLDGSKTGHRMPVKGRTGRLSYCAPHPVEGWCFSDCYEGLKPIDDTGLLCHLGAPGSRVWVRETWCYEGGSPDDYPFVYYRATPNVAHQTDCRSLSPAIPMLVDCGVHKWRSPVTMPRWASRIELETTAVRVIRVDGVWTWDCDWKRVDCRAKAALEG